MMTLDLRTLLIVQAALMLIHGVAWAIVWRVQPKQPGLAVWTASIVLNGIGVVLLVLRDAVSPWLSSYVANVIFIYSAGLMQFAHADLLHRPRQTRLVYICIAVVVLVWPVLLGFWPDERGYRTLLNTPLLAILALGMSLTLWQSNLPQNMRAVFVSAWALHGFFSIGRGLTGIGDTVHEGVMDPSLSRLVWACENIVATIAASITFGVLLGLQLHRNVRQRNDQLVSELQQRADIQRQLDAALVQETALRREQHGFIARIADDFRNPLLHVIERAEVLTQNPAIASRAHAIVTAAQRLRTLIDTFLLDRQVSEHLAQQPQGEVELGALLSDLAEQRQPPDRPGRIHLRLPETPVQVQANAAMLSLALANLIDNALKYSPLDQPVALSLSISGEEAEIRVADRGIGIPAQDLHGIGTRFFRAGNAATIPGTGLGLFSAARLIQWYGGRFTVHSQPGQGTIFTVYLPLPGARDEAQAADLHRSGNHAA